MLRILKKVINGLLMLGMLISLNNCATPEFKPNDEFTPVTIEDKVAKKFTLEIDKLQAILEKVHKMDKPVPIYLKRDGTTNTFTMEGNVPANAEIIGYLVKEHNKIVAKVEQGNMMGEIADLLVQRVQVEVETYNALIDYAKLTQMTAERYRQLWINAENRVLQLEHKLKVEEIENKVTFAVIIAGVIVVLAL